MSRLDITKTNLCIKQFDRVMKTTLHSRSNPLETNGRVHDGLIYVIKGSCRYTFSSDEFTANEGDIIYLANGASYKMRILTDSYEVTWCDFLFDSEEKRKSALYTLAEGADAYALFKKLYKAYTSLKGDSFQECMSIVYRIYGVLALRKNSSYVASLGKSRIQDIASYVNGNYQDRDLSVSHLAQRAGVSEVYFRKLFGTVMGCAPAKYITLVRLKNAEMLLGYEFMTLDECSIQCGFSSVQYFNRVFKSAYGVSPAKYRKSLMKKKNI